MTAAEHDAIYRLAIAAKRAKLSTEDIVAAAPPTLAALIEGGVPALEIVRALDELLSVGQQPAA